MRKEIGYLLAALLSLGGLTACDSNTSELTQVVPEENGGSNGGDTEDGGNEGGNEGGTDPTDPTDPAGACEGKEFANALSALKKRDASKASEQELVAYSQCVLELQKNNPLKKQTLATIYQGLGETFSWDPKMQSHAFKKTSTLHSFPILGANDTTSGNEYYENNNKEYSLAVAREFDGHRYIALAANPVFIGANASTSIWMKNMVNWLTEGQNSNTATYRLQGKEDNKLHVIIAQMKRSSGNWGNYGALKSWLEQTYPGPYTLNEADSCDDLPA